MEDITSTNNKNDENIDEINQHTILKKIEFIY